MKKKVMAGFLAVAMLSSLLTGCGSGSSEKEQKIRVNEPMSSGLKWINSSIEGAIDKTTDVSEKDDFYTAVNKKWLLETHATDEDSRVFNILGSSMDKVTERQISLIEGKDDPEADGNYDIPEECLDHVQTLVQTFGTAAGDWDRRNSEGTDVLKKYIQYIEDISTVNDLKDYFVDEDGQNLYAIELAPLLVDRSTKELLSDENDTKTQYATVTSSAPLSMQTLTGGGDVTKLYTGEVSDVIGTDTEYYNKMKKYFSSVMTDMGYSETDAETILKQCLKFECRLVDHEADSQAYEDAWEGSDPISRAELEKMEGDYPLTELLDAYGYDTDEIIVMNPSYVKYIGSIVKDSRLDEIRAWLTVNTVMNSMDLLDWDTHELFLDADEDTDEDDSSSSDSPSDTDEDDEDTEEQLQIQNTQSWLNHGLDLLYVSKYCTNEEKEDISEMINQLIDQYRDLIREEDWMGDDTKKQAIAKLDNLGINVILPDDYDTCEYLDFGDDTELLDLVADISQQSRGKDADQIGQPTSNDSFPEGYTTTMVNAFYYPSENSINILAGYIAGDTYDYSMSEEEKLARLGVVIGHEISHGFDDSGSQWDKDGRYNNWWNTSDVLAFTTKVANLQSYYSSITPYPGGDELKGKNFTAESIADMGGMKVALRLAAEDKNFDYKEFFENFAMLFAEKDTFETAGNLATGDSHPLAVLRCNITLSQFDEFLDAYGIQKGDGMYVASKDRVIVW